MNPTIRKELEDSANPACGMQVEQEPDGTWSVVTEHPILGVVDVERGFESREDAQLHIDVGYCLSGGENIDVDLEIEMDNEYSHALTESEWLGKNRDVPSKVVLDPSYNEGVSYGTRPRMILAPRKEEEK